MIDGLELTVRRLLLPKAGSLPLECEDAIGICRQRTRFCVADGATEGFDSRFWARLLVRAWIASEKICLTREQFEPWLGNLGARFQRKWGRRKLSWYAEEKAASGAFAAFVGLTFSQSLEGIHWEAAAVGDACLIHRRNDRLVRSFPLDDPGSFGYRPHLIPSNPAIQVHSLEKLLCESGEAERGDTFLLLSDAIAAWYLYSFAANRSAIQEFEELLQASTNPDDAALLRFVNLQRDEGTMKNDDVAVLEVTVESLPVWP